MTKELFPKWLAADLVVYASPLYHYTISAAMKTFIERTLPVALPFFEQGEGRPIIPCARIFPRRWSCRWPVCRKCPFSISSPPMSAFSSDFEQIRWWRNCIDRQPKAWPLRFSGKRPGKSGRPLCRPAGRSSERPVSPETMALLTQDFIENKEMFTRMGNAYWKTCIAEGVTPREFEEKGLVPRADSIETFMMLLRWASTPKGPGTPRPSFNSTFQGKRKGPVFPD